MIKIKPKIICMIFLHILFKKHISETSQKLRNGIQILLFYDTKDLEDLYVCEGIV